jgi:hypothetical protein
MGFQIQRKERVFSFVLSYFVSSQLICESVVNFSLSSYGNLKLFGRCFLTPSQYCKRTPSSCDKEYLR